MTIQHTQELTMVQCCCGIAYAIPEVLDQQLLSHRESDPGPTKIAYCPLGHSWHYTGVSAEAKAKRRAAAAEAQLVAANDQLAAEKRAHARTRKRVSNGVCPCCHRQFANVKRHMTTKHPGYAETP